MLVLALCQATAATAIPVMATVSALAGQELAVDKGLATLPIALQQLAVMLTTFPASMLMKRLGRRPGFTLGSLVGLSGGLLQAHAVFAGDFALFCLGNALVGVANGFTLFYRFAAIDAANSAFKSKAISLVMGGGVAAGFCGPLIARWSHDWFQPVAFAGAFIAIALLQGLAGLLVQFICIPRPTLEERRSAGRPLPRDHAPAGLRHRGAGRHDRLWHDVAGDDRHPAGDVGAAAFRRYRLRHPVACARHVPAHLFHRASGRPLRGAPHHADRAGVLLACAAVNLSGIGLGQFWAALVLLGMGWNFLYIGSSRPSPDRKLPPAERAKTQAANDFLVFGVVTLASFASGLLHHLYGWQAVNAGVLLPVALLAGTVLWLSHRRRQAFA